MRVAVGTVIWVVLPLGFWLFAFDIAFASQFCVEFCSLLSSSFP